MANGFRRVEPGRYRSMRTDLWQIVAGMGGDATRLLLYCWVGPHSQSFGILRIPDSYIQHDLGWKGPQLRTAWEALDQANLAWRDGDLVVVVPFLLSNMPANENVVKGWRKALGEFPASPLFQRLYHHASDWLTPDGLAWLRDKAREAPPPKPFRNGSKTVRKLREQEAGNREQEPGGREQGVEGGEPRDGACLTVAPPTRRLTPLEEFLRPGADLEGRIKLAKKNGDAKEDILAALAFHGLEEPPHAL